MSSFPRRYRDSTFDNFVATEPSTRSALMIARSFAAESIRSLVFAGPTGSGKTHLAIAAAHARPARKLVDDDAMWCSVPELIVGLRSDMNRRDEDRRWDEEVEVLRRWHGAVVLDDLGQEKVSDWTGEVIYTIVNARYNELLPTIATTNLNQEALLSSPYWSVISRLSEDGEFVTIAAADHRFQVVK
jgi:DNA replication protein DnaC